MRRGERGVALRLVVVRWTDGSYLEDQDAWKLSGLIRDVYVLFPPAPCAVFDLCWETAGDRAVRARCDVTSFCDSSLEPVAHFLLRFSLRASGLLPVEAHGAAKRARGAVVAESDVDAVRPGVVFGVDASNCYGDDPAARRTPATSWSVEAVLSTPEALEKWSPDRPFLYALVVEVVDGETGVVLQAEACYVARRDVAISPQDGVLRLNGARLTVAGVNRHETCPRRGGPHVSRFDSERDAVLLKSGHFNCVRLSHYPQAPAFYAACDRAGLLVVDEANVETHGWAPYPGELADSAAWRDAYFRRVQRMVLRDRSHPSVFMWSLGNESGYGGAHDDLADWLRAADPTRPVHYEPASWACYEKKCASSKPKGGPSLGGAPQRGRLPDAAVAPPPWREPPRRSDRRDGGLSRATDVLCPMYARLSECERLLADDFEAFGVKRPLVLCEYAHAMGNSCGNLDAYWRAFRDPEKPRCQGGFIWDLADQGLRKKLGRHLSFWAYGGDFGELPTDETFCLNGLLFPDRALKPTWHEAAACQRPFGAPRIVDVRRCGDGGTLAVVRVPSHASRGDVGICDRFEFCWTLECDGVSLAASDAYVEAASESPREARDAGDAERIRALEVGPGARLDVRLDAAVRGGRGVYALSVGARLKRDEAWAPRGTDVAVSQVVLDDDTAARLLGGECGGPPRGPSVGDDLGSLTEGRIPAEFDATRRDATRDVRRETAQVAKVRAAHLRRGVVGRPNRARRRWGWEEVERDSQSNLDRGAGIDGRTARIDVLGRTGGLDAHG